MDQDAFFKDYAEAHAKLSNLGAKFDPPEVLTELRIYIYIYILLASSKGERSKEDKK